MLLYNVTVNVENDVVDEWKAWMKNVHIPEMMETGLFADNRFLKMLSEVEDNPGTTFAIQYFCNTQADLDTYFEKFAPEMRQRHSDKYGEKIVAFRTLLEEI